MTTSSLTRRARLRSRATLEPYVYARDQLLLAPASLPVVPPASESQTTLEGLVFHALRTLHLPEIEKLSHLPGALEILRLYPARDRLLVDLAPAGAARTIAAHVLPETAAGSGAFGSGVPGLRMRAVGRAVEVLRLGHQGSIIFRGVTATEIREQHAEIFDRPHDDCASAKSPGRTAPQEHWAANWTHPGELQMTSSIVRRFGILKRLGATSIDTWTNRPGRIAVEVFAQPLSDHEFYDLVTDLSSPRFTPQWEYLGPTFHSSTLRIDNAAFRLIDGSGELELKLRFEH